MLPSPKKLRLFLVDDDEDVLLLHTALLEHAGHEVIAHVDAATSIPEMKRKRPDAVIVDVVMGGLDGLAFCRMVRERPELNQTTIIALTSLSSPAYWRERLVSAGADGLVSKPLTPDGIQEIEKLVAATASARKP